MRATLLPDPHRGPGYSVIELYGAPPLASPVLLIRRASDGAWLSGSGWGAQETSLTAEGWDSGADDIDSGAGRQRLMLGPGVVDDLDPGDDYTLTIPGAGSCALMLAGVNQSHIIGGEPVGVTPPPVPGFTLSAPGMPQASPENAVNEGVEPTPELQGGGDAGLPTGVAAAPASEAEPTPQKRPGCALMGVVLLAGLLGAGALLGQGATGAPAASDAPSVTAGTGETAAEPAFASLPGAHPDAGAAPYEDVEKPTS